MTLTVTVARGPVVSRGANRLNPSTETDGRVRPDGLREEIDLAGGLVLIRSIVTVIIF